MSKKIIKKSSASPKVRKFARELGANIVEIPGSQRAGRVTEEDVKKFVKSQVSVNEGKIEKKIYKDEYPHEAFGGVEMQDLPRVKKLSGPQLVRSWTEIPHVTQHDEIDVTEMEQFRTSLIDNYTGEKIRISPLAFITRAVVNALKKYPNFNSSIDSQNNKWIITHQGVWVIQESTEFWPSEDGLNAKNSGLLSDVVYDIAFDDNQGLAYLATDKGISILQIPFSSNPTKKESMYLSPNPFIIPDNEFVIIKNIPSGSTIQIMTITGHVIKSIELDPNISQFVWNGYGDNGKVVGTAVYLVAAKHPNNTNMISKLAVIRK